MTLPAASPSPIPELAAPAIALRGVGVEFDGRKVLDRVDLEVADGEFLALIGPSGGGKSTLLRVIAGLQPATGALSVAGQPAMVFQDHRLLPWRDVRANVGLPRDLTGRGAVPEETLAQVGMGGFADLYPHQLSGGMRARVAIARAFAQDSRVLLMDEPFAALDALVRERFNEELARLHKKTGKTIVFVTHSIREAVYLADRVAVLRDGRLETVLDARGAGRISAFTEGLEGELRSRLGVADSTHVEPPPRPLRPPWEAVGVLLLTALVLGVWTYLSARISPLFFPSPVATLQAAVQNATVLWTAALDTLRVTVLAIGTSLFIGVPIGYAMGRALWVERLLSPFVVALQAIPTIVLAPLLVVLLGYGTLARVVIATLVSLFPVLVSTMVGTREVDRLFREVFRTIGASGWSVWRHLELPGALPVVLGGLRLTVSLALIGTVVGDFVLGGAGLGNVANTELRNGRPALAYAAVTLNALLALAAYLAVALLERWALSYRRR